MMMNRDRINNLVACVLYAIAAVGYYLVLTWGKEPYVFTGSDAGFWLSVAAARINPACFASDAFFHDPAVFAMYKTVQLWLIAFLPKVFSSDLGTAFMRLEIVHVFLMGAGFYVLGNYLFRARWYPHLFALACFVPSINTFSDPWGLFNDPVARSSVQALFPWIMCLLFVARRKPVLMLLLTVALGAVFYVHLAYGAVIFGICFFAMAFALPRGWTISKRIVFMSGLAVLWCMIIGYFLVQYHGAAASAGERLTYAQTYALIVEQWGREWVDIGWGVLDFFSRPKVIVLSIAAAAGVAVMFTGPCGIRDEARTVLVCVGALVLITFVIPYIDGEVCRRTQRIPALNLLGRGISLYVPLTLMLFFMGLWTFGARMQRPWIASLAGLLFFVAYLVTAPMAYEIGRDLVLNAVKPQFVADRISLARFLRAEPRPVRILPVFQDELFIRYYALKPIVFSWKDGNLFAMNQGTKDEMLAWQENMKEYRRYRGASVLDEALFGRLVAFAESLQADWLIIDSARYSNQGAYGKHIIFRNSTYKVFDLTVTAADR